MSVANSAAFHNAGNNQGFQLSHNAGFVYNSINVAQAALPSNAIQEYDFGVRLRDAPQIDEDHFIGRDHETEQLQTWLTPRCGRQNVVAVHGIAGVGKTQLSIHLIKQSASRYSTVYWLNAKDEKSLKAGLVALAMEVTNLSSSPKLADNQDEDQLVQRARHWLSQPGNDKWLIVYDNYDNPDLPGKNSTTGFNIRDYFPYRAQGSILITTRSPELNFAKRLRITKLHDVGQSLAILATRSGRKVDGDSSAEILAQRLDGLPLALATAGAYLSQSTDSFNNYLELYNYSWNDLSQYSRGLLEYDGRNLYSTWNVSFQHVQDQDPAAAELLKLIAYLDNQDLWYDLFNLESDIISNAPAWWTDLVQSRARFNQAISTLHTFSLLEVNAGHYSLHTCQHHWMLEYLNKEFDHERLRIAVHCIAINVNWGSDPEDMSENQRLLPHLRRLDHDWIRRAVNWSMMEARDVHHLAHLYEHHSTSDRAERMYLLALQGYQKEAYQEISNRHESPLNCKPTAKLDTSMKPSSPFGNQGKLLGAEEKSRGIFNGKEKEFDHKHLLILSDLGNFYREQGKLVEAKEMYRRALDGCKRALHPDDSFLRDIALKLQTLQSKPSLVSVHLPSGTTT